MLRRHFLYPGLFAFYATVVLCAATLAQEQDARPEDSPPAETQPAEPPPASEQEAASDTAPQSPRVKSVPQPVPAKKQARPWEAEEERNASGPDIFLLPDKSGNLRKVLGFRYEDFLQAWQEKDNVAKVAPPKYLFESIRVSGTASDSHARLEIELEILPRVEGWIDVPLELPSLLVQQWEIDEQSDEECLIFDQQRAGHVLWLKVEPNQRRTLKLQGLSKLKLAPTNPGLELKLPHASASQFVLRVPLADAQFEVSPGIDLQASPSEDGGTEIRLRGQTRPLRIQWKSPEQREQAGNTVVEVVGKLAVRIDRRRAHYEAELKINSYGNPLEQLRVRLPAGAKLTSEQLSEEYRVVEQSVDPERGNLVAIERSEASREPWSLRLSAEQPLVKVATDGKPDSEEDATYQVTGFEVLDVFRQSGTLTLRVDDQLQAYFDLHGDIEQTPNMEAPGPLQSAKPIASFAYSRFPWKLDVHAVDRQLRVSVKPQYELQIHQNEADLRVEFDYQFAGAQTFSVRIGMRGWELADSPIESGGAVDLDRVFEKPGGLLVLPLVNPDVQRVHLTLALRRKVQLGPSTFPLPEAQEAFVLPGLLSVEADPSLQVTPTIAATEGVSVIPDAKDPQGLDTTKDILRLRTFLSRAALNAEIKRRERQVAIEVQTHVEVDQQKIRVLQQFNYDVRYRPLSLLLLLVPEPLWNHEALHVQVDGEEVQVNLGIFSEELADSGNREESAPAAVAVRQLRVSLPRPRQNKFQLNLSYEVPCPDLAVEAMSPLVLPLVAPDNRVINNLVSVQAEKPIRATLNQTADEGPWEASAKSESSKLEPKVLQLKGTGKPASIPLLLQIEPEDEVELPTLEGAWLQTWIVGKKQQLRAAFRFRTSQASVFAQLPAALQKSEVEVLLDGSPTEFDLLPNKQIRVSLPGTEKHASHTLELRYQRGVTLAGWRSLQVKLPRLECRRTSAPVFWQLILPRSWHAAGSPDQLAAEFRLGWNATHWGRQPTYNQSDLEYLTGAAAAPPPPPSSNQYVYRGFEMPPEIEVLVVPQLWLIATGSLATFGLGLLLVTTSLAKRGVFWLLLSLALAALLVSAPEITLLAVQAIFWGGVMTLSASVLRKAFVKIPQPAHALTPIAKTASTAVTESWIHGQAVFEEEAETTSLQAGGRRL